MASRHNNVHVVEQWGMWDGSSCFHLICLCNLLMTNIVVL